MITRGSAVIPPRGSTRLEAGDHLFVVLKPINQPFVDCVFSQAIEASRTDLPNLELRLKGSTKVEDVWDSYGIDLATDKGQTLDQLIKRALDSNAGQGAELMAGSALLIVREQLQGRITTVGIQAVSLDTSS